MPSRVESVAKSASNTPSPGLTRVVYRAGVFVRLLSVATPIDPGQHAAAASTVNRDGLAREAQIVCGALFLDSEDTDRAGVRVSDEHYASRASVTYKPAKARDDPTTPNDAHIAMRSLHT